MSRAILVPIDGSDPAWRALEFALEHHSEADITVCYVVSITSVAAPSMFGTAPVSEPELVEIEEAHAESVLSDADSLAGDYDTGIETETVHGVPQEAIIDYAENHAVDQIIMGSHGRSGVTRVVIGSVAEKVTRHASVPVTIVHADPDA